MKYKIKNLKITGSVIKYGAILEEHTFDLFMGPKKVAKIISPPDHSLIFNWTNLAARDEFRSYVRLLPSYSSSSFPGEVFTHSSSSLINSLVKNFYKQS